ncbi:L,D-transpeptidase family protein [Edaphobacter aggregans]|uniref:L,D-transpeptidase family protein n=1 Tax=Edaphobacter aggregans TaxID=570835 RepID=UPI000A066B03|nr:L,D-transpeptidase family protein [Edaphobacter aggregans]
MPFLSDRNPSLWPLRRLSISVLMVSIAATGCKSQTPSQAPKAAPPPSAARGAVSATAAVQSAPPAPAQVSPAFAARVKEIAAAGQIAGMERPNFSDYTKHFVAVYEASGYAPLWLRADGLSKQGAGVIQAVEVSAQKGLSTVDYDASRWPQRVDALKTADDVQKADFDAELTVAAMRYISDLHIGRVNPRKFNFGIDVVTKKYDLPGFLVTTVVNAADVHAVLEGVEPAYNGYRRTAAALNHYQQLAAQGDGAPVPAVTKSVGVGDNYPGVAQLVARLRQLGDMPAGSDPQGYDDAVAEGVKHFQERHGMTADGKLGAATVRELNVPLATRVQQLSDALERWRWMPLEFPQPPVVVNIPEFRLRAFESGQKIGVVMNVVVGKAAPTQTPVFTDNIRYIVFRPYWNVPPSIIRSSVIPGINRGGSGYLEKEQFEVTGGCSGADMVAGLRSGKCSVRQKPGPKNSLGLIKFIFPNSNNVYLHSTPATQLFSQSRRDFSHGCIRLEHPAELAAFLLRNQDNGRWTEAAAQQAMDSGPDNRTVNLNTTVPVLILYVTAVVDEDGSVHFFDDIYGHDRKLEAVLAKGPPYPW